MQKMINGLGQCFTLAIRKMQVSLNPLVTLTQAVKQICFLEFFVTEQIKKQRYISCI